MVRASIPNGSMRAPIPGGWHGSELVRDPGSWRVPLPADVRDDLLRAAANLGSGGISADPRQPRPKVSERTRSLVAELYRRLAGEPGVVVLTGFPVTESRDLTEAAYLVLGKLLGQPILQTQDGNLLARVEDTPDVKVPGAQGVVRSEALPFHIDRCTDLIGLLCVRSARTGALSSAVSSRAIHNALLARHPALLSVLYQPVPIHVPPMRDSGGDQPPHWCEVPIYSQVDGHFAAYYSRIVVDLAQQFPDAPPLTQLPVAMDAVDELVAELGLSLEFSLEAGDLELVNNLSVLHGRTAYQQEPSGRGRLVLRLHLAFAGSPALPASYGELFGATAAGAYRGGLSRTRETREWFGAPVPAGGEVS